MAVTCPFRIRSVTSMQGHMKTSTSAFIVVGISMLLAGFFSQCDTVFAASAPCMPTSQLGCYLHQGHTPVQFTALEPALSASLPALACDRLNLHGRRWPASLPKSLLPLKARRFNERGRGGIPGLDQLEDMWRRRLKLTAVLVTVLFLAWLVQAYSTWCNLQAVNARLPPNMQVPNSAAVQGWLFGVPTIINIRGHNVPVTVGALETDFCMDKVLVSSKGQLHRLLTSCLVHSGVFHIMFNLGYLRTLAPMEAGARGTFLCTFLLSVIGGNLAFAKYGVGRRVVGASGGICGLLGLELVELYRARRQDEFQAFLKRAFGILSLGAFLPGVCNWAHAGGLLTGLVVGLLTGRRRWFRRPLVPWPVLLAAVCLHPKGRHFLSLLYQGLAVSIKHPGLLSKGIAFH